MMTDCKKCNSRNKKVYGPECFKLQQLNEDCPYFRPKSSDVIIDGLKEKIKQLKADLQKFLNKKDCEDCYLIGNSKKLKVQIEKMKNCRNCKYFEAIYPSLIICKCQKESPIGHQQTNEYCQKHKLEFWENSE